MYIETITPRFGDIDGLRHVNNTVIPGWFEQARNPIYRIFNPEFVFESWNLILAHRHLLVRGRAGGRAGGRSLHPGQDGTGALRFRGSPPPADPRGDTDAAARARGGDARGPRQSERGAGVRPVARRGAGGRRAGR